LGFSVEESPAARSCRPPTAQRQLPIVFIKSRRFMFIELSPFLGQWLAKSVLLSGLYAHFL